MQESAQAPQVPAGKADLVADQQASHDLSSRGAHHGGLGRVDPGSLVADNPFDCLQQSTHVGMFIKARQGQVVGIARVGPSGLQRGAQTGQSAVEGG